MENTQDIVFLESPSHKIKVDKFKSKRFLITFDPKENNKLNKDFVLLFNTDFINAQSCEITPPLKATRSYSLVISTAFQGTTLIAKLISLLFLPARKHGWKQKTHG